MIDVQERPVDVARERGVEAIESHGLTIEIVSDGETRLVRLSGELDLANSPRLTDELLSLLSSGRGVVVDLDRLDFIDSSGLQTLLVATRHAQEHNGRLSITRPKRPAVARLFEMTAIDAVLPLVEGDIRPSTRGRWPTARS